MFVLVLSFFVIYPYGVRKNPFLVSKVYGNALYCKVLTKLYLFFF